MSTQIQPSQQITPEEEGPPAEAARLDAFISYTRRPDDTAFVDRLRDELLAGGKQVWLDRHRIEPAADWRQRIAQGITAAKALLFVVSPESLASSECAQELEIATQQSKLIVPVIFKDVDPKSCPEALTKPNWVYYRATDDPVAALARVVEALDADLEWRDTHARLGVRAQEWTAARQDSSFLLRGGDLRQAEAWYDDKDNHKQQPTVLHYRYIAASRRAASKRQRIVMSGVAFALVVALVLAVVAYLQRDLAVKNEHLAVTNEHQAVTNEHQAVRNEQVAVNNEHVALSRQLAAQGTASLGSDPDLSALYSLKALQIHLTAQAESALRAAAPNLQLLKTFVAGTALDAAAYSPNGNEAVTVGYNGTADIWDTKTGALVRKLVEPANGQGLGPGGAGLTAASWSADGSMLVTASDDGTARVWDASTGKQMAVLLDFGEVEDAVFSPNDGDVLVANDVGTADIWDIATQKLVRKLSEPGLATMESAVFSANGAVVLTANDDGTARFWDAAKGTQLGVLTEPGKSAIVDAAFSPNDSEVITASADGTARIWDTSTGAQVLQLGLRSGNALTKAAFSPNGRYVVTAGNGSEATVWDATTGDQVTLLDEPQGGRVKDATFSPDSQRVLTSDVDGTARVWDAAPTQLLLSVPEPDRATLSGAAFNAGGSEIVTAGTDGTARVWDAVTGAQVAVLDEGKAGSNFAIGGNAVNMAAFSPNGTEVVTASRDGTARIWDVATGRQLVELPAQYIVYAAQFSANGAEVMTANDGGQVTIWDAASGKMLSQFAATNTFLYDAALSPGGTEIATTAEDGTARIWDVKTSKQLLVVHEPAGNPMGTVAFNPAGTEIVTASDDGSARIWDLKTGAQLLAVHDPGGYKLYDAAFSPDGSKIVTASGSGDATIWDATSGKALVSLGYAQGVTIFSAAFSPNGRDVLTASYDGLASVWSATLSAPLAQVEQMVTAQVDGSLPASELAAEKGEVGG